jgi:tetratricopeptide (TPR) repeat protein
MTYESFKNIETKKNYLENLNRNILDALGMSNLDEIIPKAATGSLLENSNLQTGSGNKQEQIGSGHVDQQLFQIFNTPHLCQKLQGYSLKNWEYEDVEILTSLVQFWSTNHPDLNVENRIALIDFLLDNFNPGSYDLLRLKEEHVKQKNEAVPEHQKVEHRVKTWVEQDPFNYLNIRDIFRFSNSVDEALEYIEQIIPYRENDDTECYAWYCYSISQLLYEYEALSQSEYWLSRALAILPNEVRFINHKGLIAFKKREFDTALPLFELADKINPYEEDIVYKGNMAHTLLNLASQNNTNRKEYLKQSEELYIECQQISKNLKYFYNIAECQYLQYRFEDAINSFLKSPNTDNDHATIAGFHNKLGNLFYDDKRYMEAIDAYKRAIDFDPDKAIYYGNCAMGYRYDNNYEEARKYFLFAIRVSSSDEEAAKYHNHMGVLSHFEKNYNQAILHYDNAIILHNTNSLYHRNKANAAYNIPNYDTAFKHYQLAAGFEADLKVKAMDLNFAGLCCSRRDKFEEALEFYLKAHENDPDNELYLSNTAFMYQRLKKYDIAIDWYNKAIRMEKNQAQNYYYLGNLFVELGQKNNARMNYEKAIVHDPQNNTYITALGELKD